MIYTNIESFYWNIWCSLRSPNSTRVISIVENASNTVTPRATNQSAADNTAALIILFCSANNRAARHKALHVARRLYKAQRFSASASYTLTSQRMRCVLFGVEDSEGLKRGRKMLTFCKRRSDIPEDIKVMCVATREASTQAGTPGSTTTTDVHPQPDSG